MHYFQRTAEDPERSELIALDAPPKLDLSRPVILHFPGFKTVEHNHNAQLDMNTRIIETHLGGAAIYHSDKQPQFFALSYSENTPETSRKGEKSTLVKAKDKLMGSSDFRLSRAPQIKAYKQDPDRYVSHDAQKFVDEVLMPALCEPHTDQLASPNELKKRLSHLTFCSNSYGSVFVHEVEHALFDAINAKVHSQSSKFHMLPSAITEAMSQVVNIAAPNVSRYQETPRLFTNILLEGRDDPFRCHVQSKAELKAHGEKNVKLLKLALCKDPLRQPSRQALHLEEPAEKRMIQDNNKNVILVRFTPPNQIHLADEDFSFTAQPGSEDHYLHDQYGHDARFYMVPTSHSASRDHPAPTIGKLYGQVLCNAVQRDEHITKNPMALLTKPARMLTGKHTHDTTEELMAVSGVVNTGKIIHLAKYRGRQDSASTELTPPR